MADMALQSTLRERTEFQGSGASAARGNPSRVLSAIQPADLSGPRDDLMSRGLGMREMERPLPDLRLSDFASDRLKAP